MFPLSVSAFFFYSHFTLLTVKENNCTVLLALHNSHPFIAVLDFVRFTLSGDAKLLSTAAY